MDDVLNLERQEVAYSKIIYNFDKLLEIINKYYFKKTIVQCHGVFDVLHIGHIKHLQKAKALGDILIVTLTPDRYVNKGPGRPYFSEQLRAEMLSALTCVDHVIINHWPTAVEAIQLIKPHLYVKGSEYSDVKNDISGKIVDEELVVKSLGGKLCFTDEITFSSSSLINNFFSNLPPKISDYLKKLRSKYSFTEIESYFNKTGALNVLVVGEAIIDVYDFCSSIGKSGKEPILVVKHNHEEKYIGGSLAIANHISSFTKSVTCLTYLGEDKEDEFFVKSKINKNVNLDYFYRKNSPTIMKRRFLDEYLKQKLFEVYYINDGLLSFDDEKKFIDQLNKTIGNYDLVIVADYGHGLVGQEAVDVLMKKSQFLAVNTQANAGNHGFHCISKYSKADLVCLAGRELNLAFRNKNISVSEGIRFLDELYKYKNILITSGYEGITILDDKRTLVEAPAFTSNAKDRVGAGDAVLAIASLLMAVQMPSDIVGLIANIVGAEAINIMGNESFVEKNNIIKYILHLFK